MIGNTITFVYGLDCLWLECLEGVCYKSLCFWKTRSKVDKVIVCRVVTVEKRKRHLQGSEHRQSRKFENVVVQVLEAFGRLIMDGGQVQKQSKNRGAGGEVIVSWDLRVIRVMHC